MSKQIISIGKRDAATTKRLIDIQSVSLSEELMFYLWLRWHSSDDKEYWYWTNEIAKM